MLQKKERLSREAFSRFFSSGKRIRSGSFDLVYTPHHTFHGAVVVSKKVAVRATERNKLRRTAYSLLWELKTKHTVTGVFILIIRKTPKPPSRDVLKEELVQIFDTVIVNKKS
jgi:ribonuclease P protein component